MTRAARSAIVQALAAHDDWRTVRELVSATGFDHTTVDRTLREDLLPRGIVERELPLKTWRSEQKKPHWRYRLTLRKTSAA